MKRILKILGIIVVVIIVVVIALPFFLNVNSFRPRLESELTSALGRKVTVGNLGLSLFSGSVSAENIAIADDPAFSKTPFVQAKALNVGVEMMPLIFDKTIKVTDLTLNEPQISLVRDPAGKWNFSSLGGGSREKPASTSSASSPAASNPNLSVGNLEVKDGRVTVADMASKKKPQVYDHVNISVKNFSFTSQFPFTMTSNLPGGGNLKLDGKAGPINQADASTTPLNAQVTVKNLDLAASGFVEPSSGVAGNADFNGSLNSDGKLIHTSGTVTAQKLKLSPKGSPSSKPVGLKYALEHDMAKQTGTLTQGDINVGKAVQHLTGAYRIQGDTTTINMKLNGQNMPVDELEAFLPALAVTLPSGSSLKGGTLSVTTDIVGPTDRLVFTGPLRLADTRLAGFDLGSKLSAISALGGAKTGSDTLIQLFSTDAKVAPEGIRTDNINLIIPSLGTVTGSGTISPAGVLNYHMSAALSGNAAQAAGRLSQVAGINVGSGPIPFFIQGTTSNPTFAPDVQGLLQGRFKRSLPGVNQGNNPLGELGGLLGKKKKN